VFRREFRGADYHRRQHLIMLGTAAVGVVLAILGFASSEPGAIGIGVSGPRCSLRVDSIATTGTLPS
jgi:hypothetical protein